MSTLEQKATKQFESQMKIAQRLLEEDGFYQLRDKKRTTEQVHELATTCVDLVLRLEVLQEVAETQRQRADALDKKLRTGAAESSYAGVQERIADLERKLSLHERQRDDERERMETLIKQRQEEWERAEKATEALRQIVSSDITSDEMRAIANEVIT